MLRLENSEVKEILNKGAYECERKNEISQFSPKTYRQFLYYRRTKENSTKRKPLEVSTKVTRQQQQQQHVPKQDIYKNSFSVLEDLEDRGMGQNEWQKEKEYPWEADEPTAKNRISFKKQ